MFFNAGGAIRFMVLKPAEVVKRLSPELRGLSLLKEGWFSRQLPWAHDVYEGMSRPDGEPQLHHCLRVASYAWHHSQGMGERDRRTMSSAALFHDIPATKYSVLQKVGVRAARLVPQLHDYERQAKSLKNIGEILKRKDLDPAALFLRMMVLKDAFKAVESRPEGDQQRIAEEAALVGAKLARRWNYFSLAEDLEDKAAKVLYPKEYSLVARTTEKELTPESVSPESKIVESNIKFIHEEMSKTLDDLKKDGKLDSNAKLEVRLKKPYSIITKMLRYQAKGKSVKHPLDLPDIYGARIILPGGGPESVRQAFSNLATHSKRTARGVGNVESFLGKDRKESGYEALHFQLHLERKVPSFSTKSLTSPKFGLLSTRVPLNVDVQLLDRHMHENNETGRTHPSIYKGERMSDRTLQAVREFGERLKSGLPEPVRGIDVIVEGALLQDLPKTTSAVDIAHYHLGSKFGDRRFEVFVNGKKAKLTQQLESGDRVYVSVSQKSKPYSIKELEKFRKWAQWDTTTAFLNYLLRLKKEKQG